MGEQSDFNETIGQPWTSDEVLAAEKYLRVHNKRMFIERESRSKIDAFPFRIIEHVRAAKFIKIAELTVDGPRDLVLPSLAALIVNETIAKSD